MLLSVPAAGGGKPVMAVPAAYGAVASAAPPFLGCPFPGEGQLTGVKGLTHVGPAGVWSAAF